MAESTNISGIADDSRPNAGRIYDYFLGGNHNFEIDRMAANKLLEENPAIPKMLKMLRWFLGEATRRLIDEGFTQFLDFASGLPVQDHIHQIAPAGTKVVYSDIDPVTVAYAQELIVNNPNVKYVHCDAGKPEELLNSGIIEKMFDKSKKIAIGMCGITYFLPDDKLIHALDTIYNWSEKGYKLFISENDAISPETHVANDAFAKMGSPFYWRTQKKFQELIKNWKVVEPGYQEFEQWLNIPGLVTEAEKLQTGGPWYGVIYEK
ncbi:SAM-dependent methyltransferase [candidate division KSB1 bacterium]|nr:SAM-dependent methyltransferase [candidate division KSB1 bacterium]